MCFLSWVSSFLFVIFNAICFVVVCVFVVLCGYFFILFVVAVVIVVVFPLRDIKR